MVVSFSNTSIPSAVLVRMTWLDGRGKASGLQRSLECVLEAQQSEYNTKVKMWCSRHQDACLIAGFYKKEIESQRVETALYLYLLFPFPTSFSQRFSHCQLRLPLRGTQSPTVTERNPTTKKMVFFPIIANVAVQTQLLLRLMLDFVSLELNTWNVSPPPLP